ncbi:MAG TPA: cyclopropane-fatty-acyl-phospholipid synthase family protein [Pirellulaceae bacterium]|nr:cyclopropane-fatty-acyl-phospholipid synthase family protein [Pirellulaceae bacterium]
MDTNVSTRERFARIASPQEAEPSRTNDSAPAPSGRLDHWLLTRALAALGHPPLTVVLWDGREISGSASGRNSRLVVRDRPALWRLVWDPWFYFGELYAAGRLEVPDGLEDLLTATYVAHQQRQPTSNSLVRRVLRRARRARRNSLSGSRRNIHHHYDIGNDFYKLWLDEQLVYTCAYFADPAMTLEEAQVAKLDHVCRKLGLQRGQHVLEAGCGWGALALFMARHYGVTVKAFNISHEQIVHARQEAQRQGLSERVQFVEADWRTAGEPCDAFVSVGMLEHVGPENYRELGAAIDRCLKPAGRGLIHSIGQNRPGPTSSWIERRIFPGAYPPALREMVEILEPHDFSVLDVENLRLHYAQTLRHWLERFEQHVGTIGQMFDERFVRIWRLYLSGSMVAFQTGGLQLFQIVFARGDNNRIPWTRAGIYSSDGEVPAW